MPRSTRSSGAVFPRGFAPTVTCINKASVDLGVEFGVLIAALQKYVDEHVAPIWGTPVKLVKTKKPRENAWTMLFLDTADQAKALHLDPQKIFSKEAKNVVAFHHYKGLPVALIFAKTVLGAKSTLSDADKISVAASHELAELLVDPGNNLWCEIGKGTYVAYEICDAVEADHFRVDGLAMSDFVYPAYFEAFRKPRSTQFDHMKKVTRPFQILKGGYAPVKKNGNLVLQSSKKKQRELKKEDRRLHRSDFREGGMGVGVARVKITTG